MKQVTKEVETAGRFIEIIDSMSDPIIEYTSFNVDGKSKGIPTLTAIATNKNGVYSYKFKHSGLIGLINLQVKLNEYRLKSLKPVPKQHEYNEEIKCKK